ERLAGVLPRCVRVRHGGPAHAEGCGHGLVRDRGWPARLAGARLQHLGPHLPVPPRRALRICRAAPAARLPHPRGRLIQSTDTGERTCPRNTLTSATMTVASLARTQLARSVSTARP